MTKLLLKLFVKNYENKDSSAVRTKVGTLSGLVGIVCNAILCAGKMVISQLHRNAHRFQTGGASCGRGPSLRPRKI